MRARFLVGMALLLSFSGCWTSSTSDSVSTPFPNVAWEESLVETEVEEEVLMVEDTFANDLETGYSGVLTLTGYLSIATQACSFSAEDCFVSLARFHYDYPDNAAFRAFVDENAGNAFVSSGSVSLGCLDPDLSRIHYTNAADSDSARGFDVQEAEIAGDAFEALMATRDQAHKVTLRLEKPVFTGGGGADDCASHFRNFEIVPE